MVRLVFGGFLIAHGLIHAAIWLPQAFGVRAAADPHAPFDPGVSWILSGLGDGGVRWLSVMLALVAAFGFVAGGAGLFAQQGWWRTMTVSAAVVSLALLVVYFDPWLSAAVLLDLALLASIGWAQWPSAAQVGV